MIRLNVPYKEKDEAKQFGARWNAEGKFWYFPGDVLPEGLQKWSTPGELPEGQKKGNTPDTLPAGGPVPVRSGEALEEAPGWLADYLSVSELNNTIKRCFDNTRQFQNIMVWGEVTNYKGPSGGHHYFAIKDDAAILPCILWGSDAAARRDFTLKAGMKVAIVGYLNYYPPKGESRLIVRQIKDAGQGAAALALLRLHARLEAEGLFDESFKKPIPKHPAVIGIVTSKDGQAIKDICKVASVRNPYVQLLLFHVNVQGQYAVETILQGIQILDGMGLDTIIVGRGGGSDEELMSYNDERVVRAIFMAKTPIISAVGHEGNWSLSDYVADMRVPTPTAAAQAALPDVMTDLEYIRQMQAMICHHMHNHLQRRQLMLDASRNKLKGFDPQTQIERRTERLQHLVATMQTGFAAVLEDRKRTLDRLEQELRRKIESAYEQRRHRCEVLITRLHGLSPTAKLVKGFGYITLNEKPVTSVEEVQEGDPLLIRIHDGQIRSRVTEVDHT